MDVTNEYDEDFMKFLRMIRVTGAEGNMFLCYSNVAGARVFAGNFIPYTAGLSFHVELSATTNRNIAMIRESTPTAGVGELLNKLSANQAMLIASGRVILHIVNYVLPTE